MDSSAQVPVGGTSGQVLTKKSGTDFDAEWKTPGVALPTGGTAEQILTKNSDTDGDASWKDAPIALPDGGDSGQVLTKNSSTNGDASWKTPATQINPLPVGGTTGQVLAKSSNTDFDVTWADQTGGGGGLPAGGKTGQYLRKSSNNDYEVEWYTYTTDLNYKALWYGNPMAQFESQSIDYTTPQKLPNIVSSLTLCYLDIDDNYHKVYSITIPIMPLDPLEFRMATSRGYRDVYIPEEMSYSLTFTAGFNTKTNATDNKIAVPVAVYATTR